MVQGIGKIDWVELSWKNYHKCKRLDPDFTLLNYSQPPRCKCKYPQWQDLVSLHRAWSLVEYCGNVLFPSIRVYDADPAPSIGSCMRDLAHVRLFGLLRQVAWIFDIQSWTCSSIEFFIVTPEPRVYVHAAVRRVRRTEPSVVGFFLAELVILLSLGRSAQ